MYNNINNSIAFTVYNKKLYIRRPIISSLNLIKIQKLCGIKLNLSGRLKGVKRARKLQFMKGMVQAQTFSFPIQAKLKHIQTKWGKFGLSITLGQI